MDRKKHFSKDEISDILDIKHNKQQRTLNKALESRRPDEEGKYSTEAIYAVLDALTKRPKPNSPYIVTDTPREKTYFIRKSDYGSFFKAAEVLYAPITISKVTRNGRTGEWDGSMDLEFQWLKPRPEQASFYPKQTSIVMKRTAGYYDDSEAAIIKQQNETIGRVEKHNRTVARIR